MAAAATTSDPDSQQLINLTSSSTSSRILFATDEWFAVADNLLNPSPPQFDPDAYCPEGKVMDGWETRRKRSAGHDWCVITLGGAPRHVGDVTYDAVKVEVDTAYFTGNQAPRISIEGVRVLRRHDENNNGTDDDNDENEDHLYTWMPGAASRLARGGGIQGTGQSAASVNRAAEACERVAVAAGKGNNNGGCEWIEILPMTPLKPGYEETRHHSFSIDQRVRKQVAEVGGITHIRVNYFPDGGVARLKLLGRVFPNNGGSTAPSAANNTTTIHADVQRIIDNSPANTIHLHFSSPNNNNNTNTDTAPPSTLPHHHPELSCITYGGMGLECSNKHYGIPMNLIRPSLGKDMGDGWETARHPERSAVVTKDPVTGLQDTPLFDWAVLKLGCGGTTNTGISRIIVDTRHFKGNFPESVKIDGCCASSSINNLSDEQVCASAGDTKNNDVQWFPLLPRVAM
eukprot:scaffold64738_cov66-Cyclotella_meneghiniana.AAC.8